MRSKILIVALAAVVLAPLAMAGVPNMTLGDDGVLYRIEPGKEGLLLRILDPQLDPVIIDVPGTAADVTSNHSIAYDNHADTVILVWQENVGDFFERIMLATYNNETWFGPVELAGDEGIWATNPAVMVHTVSAFDEETEEEYSTTFLHLAWWSGDNLEEGGNATVCSMPMEGADPVLKEAQLHELRDLIAFGIICGLTGKEENLKHPRLFLDPQTGTTHVLFVDLRDCLFGFFQFVVEEPDDLGVTEQRRRLIGAWRERLTIRTQPDLVLKNAQFDVGHNLSVAIYWDKDEAIDYTTLRRESWSKVKTLQVGDELDHEKAVALIRSLAR